MMAPYVGLEDTHGIEKHKAAIESFNKSLTDATELGCKKSIGEAYYGLGDAHSKLQNYNEAIEFYHKYLTVATELGCKESIGEAYQALGTTHFNLENYKEAIEFYHKYLTVATELGCKRSICVAYFGLGIVHGCLKNYNEEIEFYHKYLTVATELGCKESIGDAYHVLGIAHLNFKKNNEAIEFYHKYLTVATELDCMKSIGEAYCGLGKAHFNLENYKEAIEFYHKYLTVATELGCKESIGEAYYGLGTAHGGLKNYNEEIEFYHNYLTVATELGCKRSICQAYGNLANVHRFNLKNYKEAIEFYHKYLTVATELDCKESICQAYGNLANVHRFNLKNYKEAIEFYHKYLTVATELGCKKSIGEAYCGLGYSGHFNLENYKEAIELYHKYLTVATELDCKESREPALEICDNDIHVFSCLGHIHISQCQYLVAMTHFEKQVSIAKQIGCNEEEAYGYCYLGEISDSINDYPKAMDLYKKALEIYELNGDKYGVEYIYRRNLVPVCFKMEKHDEAIMYFEKALNCLMERIDRKAEYALSTLNNLTLDFFEYMGSSEAIEYFLKRLIVSVKSQNRELQALLLKSLGEMYVWLKNVKKAEEYFEEQLKLSMDIGFEFSVGEAYISLATILYSKGKYSEAIQYLKKSSEIAAKIDNEEGEAKANLELGNCYCALKHYSEAIRHYEMTLTSKHEGITAKSRLGRLYFEISFSDGDNETINQDNYNKSEIYLREAIKDADVSYRCLPQRDYENISILDDLMLDYTILTEILFQRQQTEEALLVCERGRGRSLSHLLIAKYSISCKDTTALEAPLLKYDDIQAFFQSSKLCILFYTLRYRFVTWVLVHNQPIACRSYELEDLQRMRTNRGLFPLEDQSVLKPLCEVYIKSLIDQVYDIMETGHHGMRCEDRSLDIRTETRGDNIELLVVESNCSDEDTVRAPSNQAEQLQQSTNVQDNRHPVFQSNRSDEDTKAPSNQAEQLQQSTNVQDNRHPVVQSNRSDEDTKAPSNQAEQLLQSTNVQDNRHPVFQSNRSDEDTKAPSNQAEQLQQSTNVQDNRHPVVQSNRSDEDTKAPSNQAEQLQQSTNVQDNRHPVVQSNRGDEDTGAPSNQQDNRQTVEILFDLLIAPVENTLTQDEIVIIPQGPLYLLPFAVLKDPKTGKFLYEMKRIRLAPSISALKTWQECPADQYHCSEGALVIGNPTVGKVMLKGEERTLVPLPKAEQEAECIGRILRVTPLTGSQATKEEVKSRLAKGVAVIHIAAHGDSQRGEIALAPSESAIQQGIPEEEDYLLTMKEVQQIGIRAKLVVLSCCYSGRGKIKQEGLVGMSRAFLAAGARAVIASLWGVNDKVTSSFMISLYSDLKRGHSASASLQYAIKEIEEDPRYRHPKYWAPFFLIGDDVTIT